MEVAYGFPQRIEPTRAAFWFKQNVPDIALSASDDGKSWRAVGSAASRTAGPNDVVEVAVALTGQPCRYLKARLTSGENLKNGFLLAETEIWAKREPHRRRDKGEIKGTGAYNG